jgi:hypothetical protein
MQCEASDMYQMAYRIARASLRAAIRHLVRYDDTDIFPHLPELGRVGGFDQDERARKRDEGSEVLRGLLAA